MPVEEEEREVKISDYYYKKSDIDTQMNNKVDKDGNKVLSDNNYTNADKAKLTNMTPADYVTSQSLSSTLSSYVVTSTLNNYYTQSEIDNIVNTINNNKISKSQTAGLVKNDGTIDTTTYSTASHTHGNLQTNGAIGTSNNANKNVITDANGKITTASKPSYSQTFTSTGGRYEIGRLTLEDTETIIYGRDYIDRLQAVIQIKAGEALTKSGLIGVNSNTETYFNLAPNLNLDTKYPILYTGAAINNNTNTNNVYYAINGANLATTFANVSLTVGERVFVEGSAFSNGVLTISDKVFVTEDDLTNNYYYILIGGASSTTSIRFNSFNNNVYKNTSNGLQLIIGEHNHTSLIETAVVPANSDLNSETYTVEGIYRVPRANISSLANKPDIANISEARVEVKRYADDSIYRFVQFFYEFRSQSVRIHYRYGQKDNNTELRWWAWKLVADIGALPTKVSDLINDSGFLTSHQDISGKANSADLATVATTGAYSDLTGTPTIPTNVSDLTNDAGFLTQHQSLDSKTITIEKQSTAETGYTATYVIKQGGVALSPKINIPKDYLVKSASLEVVGATPTTLETNNNLVTGDKYLKFVVNTQENDDITNLIIPVNDLGQEYDADNTTIVLNNGVFSVKSNVFADKTHTHSQYLTDHQSITGKEDVSNKSSSITTDTGSTTKYPTVKAVEDYAEPKKEIGTFTELKSLIDNANDGDIIVLDKDYINSDNIQSITTAPNKSIHIDGNGHVLNFKGDNRTSINMVANKSSIENCIITEIGTSSIVLVGNNCSISNCVFKQAVAGASLTITGTNSYITDCIFYDNNSGSSTVLINISPSGNESKNFYIKNCLFFNNNVYSLIYLNHNSESVSFVDSCEFLNNTTLRGGITHSDGNMLNNNVYSNCIFNNNIATGSNTGGAMTVNKSDTYSPILINNKFITSNDTVIPDTVVNQNYLTEHQNISGKEDINNKVTSLSSSSTDTQYPSAKLVYDNLNNKIDASNVDTMTATINYTDNTSETVTFYIAPTQND